jgi:hypothetical protein
MSTMDEELSKAAPGPLAVVQALVNTQYGQGRRALVELKSPEQLRAWLVAHRSLRGIFGASYSCAKHCAAS